MRDVPSPKLPGFDSYCDAVRGVKRFCDSQGKFEGGVKNIWNSLSEVSSKPTLRTLFVSDNGIGLDGKRMASLLDEGCSTKKDGGGSHGIGHQSAFGLTNLRYVLYGGLRDNGKRIAAGHAVLATQQPEGSKVRYKELRSKDGYLVKGFRSDDLFTDAAAEQSQYLFLEDGEVPALVAEELDGIQAMLDGKSGSVVIIPGFNDFGKADDANGDIDEEVCKSVIKAIARNFFVALAKQSMEVEAIAGETKIELTEGSVGKWLDEVSGQRYASTRGFPSGAAAYESFVTLSKGEYEELAGSWGKVGICLRKGAMRKKIALCRDGMWITDTFLRVSEFEDKVQFDALILVDQKGGSGEIGRVIRDAEPGHHNQILPKLLEGNKKDRAILREFRKDLLKFFADRLEDIGDEEHALSDFLAIDASKDTQKAKGSNRMKPPQDEPPGPEPSPIDPPPGPSPVPIPPVSELLNISVLRIPADKQIVLVGSAEKNYKDVTLRISADSGADASCDGRHFEYLPLKAATLNDEDLDVVQATHDATRTEGFRIPSLSKGDFKIVIDVESSSSLLTLYPSFHKIIGEAGKAAAGAAAARQASQ